MAPVIDDWGQVRRASEKLGPGNGHQGRSLNHTFRSAIVGSLSDKRAAAFCCTLPIACARQRSIGDYQAKENGPSHSATIRYLSRGEVDPGFGTG
jgi:hypothetical protein